MSHRVFLSSTFSDLAEYRKAAQAGVRQLGAIDVSMEHFGARDERPANECIRLVKEESDVFVGIYAHRYGYVPEGERISISEMEYKAASEKSLPRFIYIVDENLPWLPAHIDTGENADRLKAFKEQLLNQHICQRFENRDQLAARVVADVGRHIATRKTPRVGYDILVKDIGVSSLLNPIPKVSYESYEWNDRRKQTYIAHRGVFLTHFCRPSSKLGQLFDVFIYLIRHKSDDFTDVRGAEFFLGPYWGDEVFPAVEENGFIGISTSAYGTFLCVCRVTFTDGSHLFLERYIDFEVQRTGGSGG